jgi:isoleucyl-tRNA synthetase
MFQPVTSRVNFPALEEKILELWKNKKTFQRSVENRHGASRFTLFEGPPTMNGSPGIHHVISRVFKDIIPRYKTMKGYYTPRIAGWDTHGLPVELEVEKQLGFSSKAQIEEYGVDRFNQRCRESVYGYLPEWDSMTERIGFWIDLDHPYITMENDYIESVWWAIKQMWDKGLVYQGYKVTPHCPRCGTSLSSHEVAQGYQDNVADPSVYIKFKVDKASLRDVVARARLSNLDVNRPAYLLAWTTTPWTLPGNTALAVAADAEYAVVEFDDEYLILASALLGASNLADAAIVTYVRGADLVGIKYEPLFNPHQFGIERRRFQERSQLSEQAPDEKLTYRVIATDFVSMEDGTGIVHMAPAYGEVDYEAGQEQGLDFVHTVDLQGRVIGNYPFSGKFVKDADPLVLDELDKKGLLFRSGTIHHTYPFCWRCESPLLYYAKQTWYIQTTAVKQSLIDCNDQINWYPDHIKYGRFGDWLENNVDWALSRERYWGTPLPVWRCESCGHHECIGSVEELKGKPSLAGLKEPLDLHRPYVDALTFSCSQCQGRMQRVPEVIDCWFDSGAMPVAQLHYPFENKALFDSELGQADYICEAVDQTRGWFYSLHAIATLLFDRPCFKNCIAHGHILDASGEKMSKSRGNVVDVWEMLNKYGADALRWHLFTAAPLGNSRRFDEKMLAELTRRFLMTLWNVYSFFVTYASIDKFTPASEPAPLEPSELDRWIISDLNQLVIDVDSALDSYDPTGAARRIETFVDDLSNWYVRRSRRRFWKSESDADKLAAYNTLYQCLVTLSRLMAPFTPFLAEELYQNLVLSPFPDAPDSVHLADFPVADGARIDRQLSDDTRLAMKVSSLGRAARSQAGIKVRQPLAHVVVSVASTNEQRSLERLKSQILEELNVKDLKFADMHEVAQLDGHGYVVSGLEQRMDGSGRAIFTAGAYLVAVPDKDNIPPELQAEGLAREIVHRLQNMRRSAGFDIADYITTCYQADDYVTQVMVDFADYIKQETLSRELVAAAPGKGFFSESHKLAGHEIVLAVKKLT